MQVLVIEDVPVTREILCAVVPCVLADAAVRSAASLDDALAVAASMSGVDFILLDLGLPGCSGLDALHTVKAALPGTKTIVVSANGEAKDAALMAGADGFVAKHDIPAGVFAAIRALRRDEASSPRGRA